jgi:hypothetical protein
MKKLMYFMLSFIMFLIIPASSAYASALFTIGSMQYSNNQQVIQMDISPFIKDSRTFLPIRYVANALGIPNSAITYYPDGLLIIRYFNGQQNYILQFAVGDTLMVDNGANITMDVAPQITNGRMCLPIAWVAQAFNASVAWNAATQTITLDNGSSSQATPSVPTATTSNTVASITITPSIVNLTAGTSQQLAVTATMGDDSTQDVTNTVSYSSSDSSVAVVTSNGLVVGISEGTATIIACSGQASSVYVTVNAAQQSSIIDTNPSASITSTQPTSAVVPSLQYDDGTQAVSKDFQWQYNGTDYTWDVEIPINLLTWDRQVNSTVQQFYDSSSGLRQDIMLKADSNIKNLILANSAKSNSSNYTSWVEEPSNYQWAGYLANDLDASAQSAGLSRFQETNFILSFVGSALPYTVTSEAELPAQSMVDSGDCKDKSILYATILRNLGYNVALFNFPDISGNMGHEAVGVAFNEDQLPQGGSYDYYAYKGSNYYFAETTQPGWTVGDNEGDIAQNLSAYINVVN